MCIIVAMNGASAMRDVTAATTDVGGRQFAEDGNEEGEEMHHPGVEPARIMKGCDDDRGDDVGSAPPGSPMPTR